LLTFSLFLTVESIFLPSQSRFGKEAFIRIETFSNHRRSIIIAEEERLVHFLFQDDDIVECTAAKRISHLLEHLMAEVERFEETGVMPENVTYVENNVDVGWYGRYCRKFMRDQLRDAQYGESKLDESRLQELLDNSWIEKGVPGTNFCRRRLPSHSFTERNIGHVSDLDRCCMNLWECDTHETRASHMPLTFQNNKLNSGLWPLWDCRCLDPFLSCIQSTDAEDTKRLIHVFNKYGSKCFTKHEVTESCDEYDLWYNKCLSGNKTMEINIHTRG